MTSEAPESPKMRERIKHLDRRLARLAAVQALYQHDVRHTSCVTLVHEFIRSGFRDMLDETPVEEVNIDLFRQLVTGAEKSLPECNALIEQHLASGWALVRIEKVALAILRVGVAELLNAPSTPAVIIVSEYADIAHAFFEEKDAAFVNGMLNRLARLVRAEEFPPHGS